MAMIQDALYQKFTFQKCILFWKKYPEVLRGDCIKRKHRFTFLKLDQMLKGCLALPKGLTASPGKDTNDSAVLWEEVLSVPPPDLCVDRQDLSRVAGSADPEGPPEVEAVGSLSSAGPFCAMENTLLC